MGYIDFQNFKLYTSVSHKASRVVDARESFADMIYNNINGIRAKSLAMKIFGSKGRTEYDKDDIRLIRTIADKMCVSGFIDGLEEQLKDNDNGTDDRRKERD